MSTLLEKIEAIGIVPVVVLQDEKDAVPLANALIKGGIPVAEVTFRTKAAQASIKAMSQAYPNMIVGAGTVLSIEQVDQAVAAGAQFIVSPGFNPTVVQYCIDHNILIIPGVSSATNIEQALSFNLEIVKLFPAMAVGGLPLIKALSAPYPQVRFMPTGGLDQQNFLSFLNHPSVLAIGGSWMVSPQLIAQGAFDQIEKLSKEAIMLTHGFALAHVGINQDSEAQAKTTTQTIASLFGFEVETTSASTFLGVSKNRMIEVMFTPIYGTNGHVAIATNDVQRAMTYLATLGVTFRADTLKKDEAGKIKSVYLQDEIGGFAFHLVQR